ncbi:MAG: S1 RNA-binding domain-containing protein [Anaerolineae bacterium]|nr:MAG: S1 RNA-binding domain-containing protein [Anaerolineae bacterium]
METTTNTLETAVQTPLSELKRKTKFTGKVIKTSLAGAIVDIGLEVPGVIHISQLSREPVHKVEDAIKVGDTVEVWVRQVFPEKRRIELTMIEPYALEWREMEPGMVVKGKVTRLEKFGAFVDIGAERPGLVHISELAHGFVKEPGDVVQIGDEVEVQILKFSRRKKQIKLSMKALQPEPPVEEKKPRKPRKGAGKRQSRPAMMDSEPQEKVPTAMEIALREAMERAKGGKVPAELKGLFKN